MNSTQRQNILDEIDKFKKSDFYTPFNKVHASDETIDSVYYSDYSVSELISLANRAILQLEKMLNSDVWQVLQCDNVTLPIYGTISLPSNISNITNRLLNATYKDAALSIKAQISYQMRYGFWEQPKRVDLKIREASLCKLETRAELTMSHVDAKVEKVNMLIRNLEEDQKQLEILIQTKKQELETLKNNQSESNVLLENIKNVQHNASNVRDSIETLNGQANNIVIALGAVQKHMQEQIQENEEMTVSAKKALEDFNSDASKKISQISNDYNKVSNHTEEVRKMMHFIKDGTLTHSFNDRKKSIQKAVDTWQWLSIISALLMGGWIFIVFKYLNVSIAEGSVIANSAAIVFANLFINIAKTSPMIVLFWFVLAQYKKERNLLEEYAFREAVAATLTSYLDQLDGETDKNKCTLLMNTVEKLYTKPTISQDEIISISLKSKDVADTVKHIKECIKE